jgi:aspartate/tyrosine/aromatic aminotransferase
MFTNLETSKPDPILGLEDAYNRDHRVNKVNLTVGVYRNSEGITPILNSVKQAELRLLRLENSKNYLSIEGSQDYGDVVQELMFGGDHEIISNRRAVTAHTPGGTGALRVAADFIKQLNPDVRVWISQPTWPNHPNVFKAAGLAIETYPYYNAATNSLAFDEWLTALQQIPAGDVVVLHGSCHNPTGVDPSLDQWEQVAEVLAARKVLPLVDFAYQGFGNGLKADATGLLALSRVCREMLVANSFSKNFGLYNERVGGLTLVTETQEAAATAIGHIKATVRANYSNPPAHGAQIVTTILKDPELRQLWETELRGMRDHINKMREKLADMLAYLGVPVDFSFLKRQRGMFSLTGLDKEQVRGLRQEFSIYMPDSGRINVAGLSDNNLETVATAISTVLTYPGNGSSPVRAEKAPGWQKMDLPEDLKAVLSRAPSVTIPADRESLISMALGGQGADRYEVRYQVPGTDRTVTEATVVRCRNGIGVNYEEPYMRRRDPDSMVVADDNPTDKPRFVDQYRYPFASLRTEIFDWLAKQELIVLPFLAGGSDLGYDALMVAPLNAGFFAASLADLQGMLPSAVWRNDFKPRAIIYVAPPFRHTHCEGKQIVVHNRVEGLHEIFSLNLYPGPSAKKGVYGVLLAIGEDEGWVTAHASSVQVTTPYDNLVTFMHEGASGSGKSEMLEYPHREADGRLLLGENTMTRERRFLTLTQSCTLRPVTDDMAICHPSLQNGGRKLVVKDAENAWFLRVNHISNYGTDANLERLFVQPPEPLVFLNLFAVAGATCLPWEHTEDKPGVPCPNPRVILPRRVVPGIINNAVEVDVRSFGIRMPPCTRERPTYGISGYIHSLPPALAWLWRLVAPRGHDNPSITDSDGLSSEGVGSYWPFATGKKVNHANLLLQQFVNTPSTRYILTPNQYVGAWKVGFMPEWISREYLARRGGAKFRPDQLRPARCALLGHAITNMHVEGTQIPQWMLEVNTQPEVGDEGYDEGATILTELFHRELRPYYNDLELDPLGRKIIECCLDAGKVEDYARLI